MKQDFLAMRHGKAYNSLSDDEMELLKSIDIRTENKDSAILLLHGFSSSPAVFRTFIPELKQHYDAIICPVLPGHAKNIEAFASAKAKDWLATAEDICESLIKEYKYVDIVGLSLGGILAAHLSHQYKLRHLYLLAPAFKLKLRLPLALKLVRFLKSIGLKNLRNRGGNIKSTKYKELVYRHVPLTTIIEILTLISEFKWNPPTCPTDIFLGKYDKIVDSKAITNFYKNLPNCKIHHLLESSHVLPLDNDYQYILDVMKKNLE